MGVRRLTVQMSLRSLVTVAGLCGCLGNTAASHDDSDVPVPLCSVTMVTILRQGLKHKVTALL